MPQKKTNKLDRSEARANLVCATLSLIAGIGLLIAGFVAPPLGEIHHSVLIAFGESLTFTGAVLGVRYHYKYKNN